MVATDESLRKLVTVPSEQEAAIVVAALVDEEIDACYMGERTANFRVGVPGKIYVYVSELQVEHARQVLAARQEATSAERSSDEDEPSTVRELAWRALVLCILVLMLIVQG